MVFSLLYFVVSGFWLTRPIRRGAEGGLWFLRHIHSLLILIAQGGSNRKERQVTQSSEPVFLYVPLRTLRLTCSNYDHNFKYTLPSLSSTG
jgi:hypothetical protein